MAGRTYAGRPFRLPVPLLPVSGSTSGTASTCSRKKSRSSFASTHRFLCACMRAHRRSFGSVDELARGSGLHVPLQIERRDLRSCVRARLRRGAIQQRLQKQFQRVLCVRAPPAPAFQSTSARARAFNHAFVIRRTHGGRRGVGDLADILIALHHALDARLRAVDREGRGE